jgi:hypothetical protein
MSLYPAGRALCSRKLNNNARFQVDFLKSVPRSFLEIEGRKGGSFDERARRRLRFRRRTHLALSLRPTWES